MDKKLKKLNARKTEFDRIFIAQSRKQQKLTKELGTQIGGGLALHDHLYWDANELVGGKTTL